MQSGKIKFCLMSWKKGLFRIFKKKHDSSKTEEYLEYPLIEPLILYSNATLHLVHNLVTRIPF